MGGTRRYWGFRVYAISQTSNVRRGLHFFPWLVPPANPSSQKGTLVSKAGRLAGEQRFAEKLLLFSRDFFLFPLKKLSCTYSLRKQLMSQHLLMGCTVCHPTGPVRVLGFQGLGLAIQHLHWYGWGLIKFSFGFKVLLVGIGLATQYKDPQKGP